MSLWAGRVEMMWDSVKTDNPNVKVSYSHPCEQDMEKHSG